MIETLQHKGVFHAFDNPGYSNEELREVFRAAGIDGLRDILPNYERRFNLLMASQKLIMANSVYPKIDALVITSQTGTPVDTESSYSGVMYTTNLAEEFTRSGNTNPYIVGWNVINDAANGVWGSFILVTSTGAMINRALAGITKVTGTAKLVLFTGTVTS